jgi:hypothetical protein
MKSGGIEDAQSSSGFSFSGLFNKLTSFNPKDKSGRLPKDLSHTPALHKAKSEFPAPIGLRDATSKNQEKRQLNLFSPEELKSISNIET